MEWKPFRHWADDNTHRKSTIRGCWVIDFDARIQWHETWRNKCENMASSSVETRNPTCTVNVFDFDTFRMTNSSVYIMRSSQLHGGIRRVNRWTTLALAIFLLTCPFVVLQVSVAPGSSLHLPPEGLKGRKPGCWQVSSEGRCRNSLGAISHGTCRASGYCEVCICGKQFKVHRLVAHAFLGPPPSEEAWQVNHIDGNGSNNQMDNLEWVSHSENMRHSYATNPSRGNAGSKRARPVMIRPLASCNWTKYSSIKVAAEALCQLYATVRYRCHRNSQVDGYEYKYAPLQQVELPGEEWRPMIDPRSGRVVSGRMVSSQGRIKTKAGGISCGSSREDGYFFSQIIVGSKLQRRTEYVHRLVAVSFLGLPPSPDHSQINHKDGNKSNNAVKNLEYVTPAENIAHRFALSEGCNPTSSKAVLSRAYGTSEEWTAHPSGTSAAEALGLHQSLVSACARSEQQQTGGCEFRFAEPEPHDGEVWRDVDLDAHLQDKERRKRRQRERRHRKLQWWWPAQIGIADAIRLWIWWYFFEIVMVCYGLLYSFIIVVLACFSFFVGHEHGKAFENTSIWLVSPFAECLSIGKHFLHSDASF